MSVCIHVQHNRNPLCNSISPKHSPSNSNLSRNSIPENPLFFFQRRRRTPSEVQEIHEQSTNSCLPSPLQLRQSSTFAPQLLSSTPCKEMMAGNQITSDSLTSNLAGMSKNQLYDIMSQMKTLIEQNQQQAKQILVDNPALTRALFQAQIMLGMVQPPQVIPNIQQAPSQPPQQPAQPAQQLNAQASHLYPVHSQQEQAIPSQTHIPARKQLSNQPPLPIPPSSAPPQSQAMASHSLQSLQQAKGHPSSQMNPMSLPQSSQIHNIPQVSHHSAPTIPSLLQSPVPMVSGQSQHSLHTSGIPHLPLQPPLPPQPRPTSMQPFQHQAHSQMGSHMSYQPSGASQPHLPQPPFNSGAKPPGSIGSSFPQGQPPLPSQPPPHSLYQVGGSHLGTDFTNQANSSITSQAGSSMQVDRPAWMPGLQDNTAGGAQLPGPPPMPGQMGIGGQPPRPQQLTQEMEKALLQQVMSLTPEQINLLPPEQRQQVLQLQQMLR